MASITVVGTGFTGATQCFFGSTGVTIALNSAGTSFTCTPPAGTGDVTIGITSFGGTVTGTGPKGYTYMGMPTITSLGTTQSDIAGWTPVRIYGANYYDRSDVVFPGNTCGVSFGNTYGQEGFMFGSSSVLYTYSPPGLTYGPVRLSVNTPTGNSNGFTFTYINPCSCIYDVMLYPELFGCSGATFPCFEVHNGVAGCDCCACCQAVCGFNPSCCEIAGRGWDQECINLITDELDDPNSISDLKKYCKHLMYGACCVKFNISGASYSICLSTTGTSYDCDDLANAFKAQNGTEFPWTNSFTLSHNKGLTCNSCNTYCAPFKCMSNPASGVTCSYCPSICCLYGYCGTGCTCNSCPPGMQH